MNIKNKVSVGLLSLIFIVMSVLICPSISFAADTGFMDGSGTEEDPYLIASKKQLDNVRYHKGAHFKLVTDIKFTKADFSSTGEFYNDGYGWKGYGWDSERFSCTFDGNGHVIDGLYQNVTDSNVDGIDKLWCRGLFGSMKDSSITNLGLTNVDFKADTNVKYAVSISGFSELFYNTIFENCYVSGNIELINRSTYIAGTASGIGAGDGSSKIINCHNDADITVTAYGDVYGNGAYGIGGAGIVRDCYNTGNITGINKVNRGEMDAGGIGGGGEIDRCYNTGTIYSTYIAGGIRASGEHTQNSYNRGEVFGAYRSGGINGKQLAGDTFSRTNNCYNVGAIKGNNKVGAIIGSKDENLITYLEKCYYLDNVNAVAGDTYNTETNNIKKCSSDELQEQETFVGFDFDEIWTIDKYSGYEYPILISNRDIQAKKVKAVSFIDSANTIVTSVNLEPTYPKVNVKYDDESSVDVQLTKENFKNFDLSKIGQQTCKVYYAGEDTGLSVKFDIKERIATSVAVVSNPEKTEYVLGQPLTLKGGKISVGYDNGTSEEYDITESMIEYDKEATGNVDVIVKVDDCTAKFTIKVNEKVIEFISVKEPTKLSYYIGDEIDITGGKVVITYQSDDYYNEEIDMKSEMISGFDSSTNGVKNVKVSYEGFESSFSVNIKALVLNEIKVTKLPDKIEYIDDEEFDNTGMEVTGYYNSGKQELITGYEISGFGTAVDKNTLTVKINDKTDTFDVTIHKSSSEWEEHPASCVEDGYKVLLCSGCKEELKRVVIPKSGHNLTFHESVDAKCLETGNNAYWSCDKCNKYFSDENGENEIEKDSWITPSLGHDYIEVEGTAVSQTCTINGKHADKKCSHCNDVIEGEVINATGHKWDAGFITKAATATETGIKTYTCSVCKETKTETIPATGEQAKPTPTVTPTEQPSKPFDNPSTDQGTKEDGVGTISADGKTLTDEDGTKYLVADKVTTDQLNKNVSIADKKSGKYKITKVTKKNGKITGGTVTYTKPYNKNCKTTTVKAAVKIAGVTFKVTTVDKNAFKGCTNLTKVTIGKNVTQIGKNAFNGCGNLKNIIIKATNLKKVGGNAFKGINYEAKFKLYKKKYTKYKKMIKKAKAPTTAKYTK